jgi:hypothetical protein
MLKHFCWLLFLAAAPLFAQTPVQNQNPCLQQACFFATQSGTVASSGATTLTIQQPATAARQVTFMGAVVQCPGQSFTIGQSQNGTAATATAGTAVALIPIATINAGTTPVTAKALVFTASNVGGGTAVAPALTYASGSNPPVIDLSQRTMGTPNPGPLSYSVTLTNTGAGNCTGSIGIYWAEKI